MVHTYSLLTHSCIIFLGNICEKLFTFDLIKNIRPPIDKMIIYLYFYRKRSAGVNNMKVKFLSDIHYDHAREEKQKQIEAYGKDADLLLIAGDFGNSLEDIQECLSFISKSCKQFVFVLGNHDLTVGFDTNIDTTEEKVKRIDEFASKLDNATLLGVSKHLTLIDNVLIGGTMGIWDFRYDDYMEEFDWKMNWFDGKYWGNDATLKKISELERERLDYITKAKPQIILTHFAPWECNTNPKYRGSKDNKYFYFNIDHYDYSSVKYWGCGHTHDAHKLMIGNTQVMLNPLGYGSQEENPYALHNLSADDFTVEI
jgi:predicted MPP superfamily phosphohydrolase